jgi:hypothetical protein
MKDEVCKALTSESCKEDVSQEFNMTKVSVPEGIESSSSEGSGLESE